MFGADLAAIGDEHYELGYVALDPYHAATFGQDFYSSDKSNKQHKWYDAGGYVFGHHPTVPCAPGRATPMHIRPDHDISYGS
eukprot:7370228-Karenia_brevis.AAC.1